jgi:hypothetical protein
MLAMERANTLTQGALSGSTETRPGMLRDVNKRFALAGQHCVSPINVQDSSNLKNHKFISLEETGFADMYPFLAGRLSLNAAGMQRGCDQSRFSVPDSDDE